MVVAVRYMSRKGNTEKIAKAIAEEAGVSAISVLGTDAKITEKTDILFIGGALYAYGLDKNLKTFLEEIDPDLIGKAVIFSTSWISKHALDLIRKELESKNIKVETETFYCKSKEVDSKIDEVKSFARKYIS